MSVNVIFWIFYVANKITTDILLELTPDVIKELIPVVGLRISFLKELQNYKKRLEVLIYYNLLYCF